MDTPGTRAERWDITPVSVPERPRTDGGIGFTNPLGTHGWCGRWKGFRLMKMNPLKEGTLTAHSVGIGTVTRTMVEVRARELAVINGHAAEEVSPTDFEQALRELTGESEVDPLTAILEAAPEGERWDPLPGSVGHRIEPAPSEDEDEEGRSDRERLVEEGVAGAEHDQMLQAARAASTADAADEA